MKKKTDSFETLLVLLGAITILGTLAVSTPTIHLRPVHEWIEHEQDLAYYAELKAEQEAERARAK